MWRSHSRFQSISRTFPSFICLIPAIMYALFVVVIIAFIGTTDLGQEASGPRPTTVPTDLWSPGCVHRLHGPDRRPIDQCLARDCRKLLGLE